MNREGVGGETEMVLGSESRKGGGKNRNGVREWMEKRGGGAEKEGSILKLLEDKYLISGKFLSCLGIDRADVMVGSSPEGVDKVEDSNGKYAFFMESSGIEYLVERRCKLAQVSFINTTLISLQIYS